MMLPSVGYSFVYHMEIFLLFATLAAIGPLVRKGRFQPDTGSLQHGRFGLADFPG
jgi:BCD family chlorophyll transporter-like MFS transporter